jgi:putative ABC transport system permease protein
VNRLRLTLLIALRNVFRNRARSLLALSTIAAGAAGLLLFGGFNTGMLSEYRQSTIHTRYGHGALYPEHYRGIAHAQPWQQWIDAQAVLPTLRAMPSVQGVFPRVPVMAFVSKETTLVGQGEGVDGVAEAQFFNQLNYVEGGDFGAAPDGIVLGRGLAKGLDAHVGDEVDVSIKNTEGAMMLETVKVSGIFFTGVPAFDDVGFRIPLALAQKALGTDRVEAVFLELKDDRGWPAFAREAAQAFPGLEAVPFEVLDAKFYPNAVAWLKAQYAFIRLIVLLVVFLGIVNIVSLTVLERTGEIGALRANGDTKLEVASGQLLEAAAIGLIGGVIGVTLGWLVAETILRHGILMPPAPGFNRSFVIFESLNAWSALFVVVLCVTTAALGAVLPVWRATRIAITTALSTG